MAQHLSSYLYSGTCPEFEAHLKFEQWHSLSEILMIKSNQTIKTPKFQQQLKSCVRGCFVAAAAAFASRSLKTLGFWPGPFIGKGNTPTEKPSVLMWCWWLLCCS
jgi:hypothetical protein